MHGLYADFLSQFQDESYAQASMYEGEIASAGTHGGMNVMGKEDEKNQDEADGGSGSTSKIEYEK